ncbi:MAG: hypothetical protein JNL60_13070 [Bacteroidia bacterium]|nr:hypothetical protein [Bacteroidia bacterium]
MKKAVILLIVLVVFCCKRKEKTPDPPVATTTTTTTTTSGSTTSGNTTTGGQAPKNAAEFEAYNSINSSLNTVYGTAKLYNTSGNQISADYIKIDGQQLTKLSDKYLYTSVKTFTAPVSWEISDSYDNFPDTTFMSKPFPSLGYTTAVNTVYDKTKDFTINIDVSTCDSMLFELGGVIKRIVGRSGVTSVTFKPTDNVKRSIYDSTEVEVSVKSYNYHIFQVRGRTWISMAGSGTGSTYKYKN